MEALGIFTKAVIDATPALLDSTAIDVPWRTLGPANKAKLRIGVLQEDPLYPLHPPVKRALAEAAKKVEAAGHGLVQVTSEEGQVADATEVACEIFSLHSETSMQFINASGEPPVPSVAKRFGPANVGNYKFVPSLEGLDFVHKYALLAVKRQEICENWRKIWLEKKLDAVMMPAAQSTAVPHDTL
jgi:amidase